MPDKPDTAFFRQVLTPAEMDEEHLKDARLLACEDCYEYKLKEFFHDGKGHHKSRFTHWLKAQVTKDNKEHERV